jgi:hypothetical protein
VLAAAAMSGRPRAVLVLEVVLWVLVGGLLVVTVGNHLGDRLSAPDAPDLPEHVPVFEFVDQPQDGDVPVPLLCPDGRQATMPADVPDDIEIVDLDTGERYPDERAFLEAASQPGYDGQGRYRPTPEALCATYPTVEPPTAGADRARGSE